VKLITQPKDGIEPILRAVRGAAKTIDVAIFRCDLEALERELAAAVTRGVTVRALVANTNRGGAKSLRALESRLLEGGITVARTDDDLVRYHGKILLIDRATLFVLGFNFTSADVNSRSFGVRTKKPKILRDILGLLDADALRNDFKPTAPDLVISPDNSRLRLTQFLSKAKESLDIYDPGLTDDKMIALLKELAAKGVTIRILGKLEKKWQGPHFDARPFPGRRLHVRTIIRDRRRVFVGSQSLRKLELDKRREVGLIVRDPVVVKGIRKVFEKDWKLSEKK
jgi:phosphatidylserine/phosphatidylglycerophosphate/cardiolipin synthase-like enzyme